MRLHRRRLLKSAARKRKSSKTRAEFFDFETLEKRQLLAADLISAAATLDTDNVHQMQVASTDEISHRQRQDESVQRIVNGTQTDKHEAVGIVNGQCTGTLIAPNAVLTAAHCVEGISGTQGTFEVNGKTYQTVKIEIHPEYQSRNVDLAVMILSENVEGVTPIELNRVTPKVGEILTLVGFGATGNGNSGHNGDFGVKHEGTTPIDGVNDVSITWNFDNNSEANTAPGDSGGPAFLTHNGKVVVAGVTSGGTRDDAAIGDFSFDTRVDAFATWIESIVGTEGGGGNEGEGEGEDENGEEGESGSTFTNNEPVVISSTEAGTVTSSVIATGMSGTITDINVKIDIDHSWAEDLSVTLISPSGQRVPLFQAIGGDGQNFDQTTLDDQANQPIENAEAPFKGSFKPMGSLASLNGESANGKWTLEVEDTFEEDGGRVNSFAVTIETNGDAGGGQQDPENDPLSQLALKLDLELELYSSGKYFDNWGGQNEKWMAGKDSWYFILPNGQLRGPGGKLVATFNGDYYANPKLLHAAGDPTLAAQLDNQLGLSSNGNYFENYGGAGEKWMQGNSSWYFILPNGQLRGPGGTLIAQLDPEYHADSSLLHQAADRANRSTQIAASEKALFHRTSTDTSFERFDEDDDECEWF